MYFDNASKTKLKLIRDLIYDNAPAMSVYPGTMEAAISSDTTTVVVDHTVRKVMSVWLTGDTKYTGTNYYADPKSDNFSGTTITLDSALPGTTTSVNVAYYQDCTVCGWDASAKAARDSDCATCDGTGMTLAIGTAISVPVKRIPLGMQSEATEAVGEQSTGSVTLTASEDYEKLIRAAIRIEFEGKKLVIQEDPSGDMRIRKMYNVAGENTMIRLTTGNDMLQ